MLHRVEPQKQKEEELKHGGNGGGGKPYVRFGGYSSSSSTVCRPDPENPGHQICKKVVKETSIDPNTGKMSTREIETEQPASGFLGFMKDRASDNLKEKGKKTLNRFKDLMHFG